MKYKYLLIKASEDCPVTFLDDEGLAELLAEPMNAFGLEEFLTEVPHNEDPNYWDERAGLLLKIEIVKPRSVTSTYKID